MAQSVEAALSLQVAISRQTCSHSLFMPPRNISQPFSKRSSRERYLYCSWSCDAICINDHAPSASSSWGAASRSSISADAPINTDQRRCVDLQYAAAKSASGRSALTSKVVRFFDGSVTLNVTDAGKSGTLSCSTHILKTVQCSGFWLQHVKLYPWSEWRKQWSSTSTRQNQLLVTCALWTVHRSTNVPDLMLSAGFFGSHEPPSIKSVAKQRRKVSAASS